jgi:transposase
MRSKIDAQSEEAEKAVRDIRRATRRHFSAEDKVRIVIAGLRGEDSVAELCRKEGINQNLYYRWSKDFLEAGKKRLAGDTSREATSDEVVAGGSHQLGNCWSCDGEPPAQTCWGMGVHYEV